MFSNPTRNEREILAPWGWDEAWEMEMEGLRPQGWIPGRILREEKELYRLECALGPLMARVTGAYREGCGSPADFPKVGDWVALAARPDEGAGTIHRLLPRRRMLARKEPFVETSLQILAVNLDRLFIVAGLNEDFNVRRLERYLAMALENDLQASFVLNKADLHPDPKGPVGELKALAPEVPVHLTCALEGQGLEALRDEVKPGQTAAFVGSSGVGKSSLINALKQERVLEVGDLMHQGQGFRGRHTTTQRELCLLPGAGVLMDTPGLREIQLWGDEEGLEQAFPEIAKLKAQCRFRDCSHQSEPGCGIQMALAEGVLDPKRLASYHKLSREARHLEVRKRVKEKRQEKAQARRRKSPTRRKSAAWDDEE